MIQPIRRLLFYSMSCKERISNIMENMIEQFGQCEALRVIFCVFFVLFFSGCCKFGCQCQCNPLPGKTRVLNDLLCVQWDVKL